jgi:hypothetical protein|tara:strand:- start:642 stop:1067 length:426 start_codon:yes stop_codon:yes gene_type:complete
MTEEEYIKERVDDQIDWYGKKSATNKNYHLWTKGLVIVFAALIPFAAGFISEKTIWLNYVIAVLGVLTAIFTGLSALLKFQEKWNEYRTTSETLKHEKYLFRTEAGPYDGESEPFKFFVSRIENLISKENSAWSQYINKDD